MADTDFYIQTLAVTPRMFLNEFFYTLEMAASTLCAEYFDEGLLTMAVSLTPARHASLGLTVTADNGTVTPAPYPDMPTRPVPPVVNASHATMGLYNNDVKRYAAITTGCTALNTAVHNACGETLKAELMTIMGRLKDQTLPKTLAYIEKRHGTLSKQDFDELTRQAKTAKFTSPEKFVAEAAQLTLVFSKLTRGFQGVSDYLKMEYLRECTSTQPAIQDAINDYEKDCLHKDTNATVTTST
jgi:hypothetical protein